MKAMHTLALLGGDARMAVAAEVLGQMGYAACVITGQEDPMLALADVWILPTPASGDDRTVYAPEGRGGEEIRFGAVRQHLGKGHLLLGGRIPTSWRADAEKRGAQVRDLTESERLAQKNALPTAEGALAIALQTMPRTLFGAQTVLIGFGRIARRLAPMLVALGAEVTVCARREEARDEAERLGCRARPLEELVTCLKTADWVCNTVPSAVVGEEALAACKKEVLLLDLASRPGGIDRYCAEKRGLTVIWALGLPGKVAPISAGVYLGEEIAAQIEEWEGAR